MLQVTGTGLYKLVLGNMYRLAKILELRVFEKYLDEISLLVQFSKIGEGILLFEKPTLCHTWQAAMDQRVILQ